MSKVTISREEYQKLKKQSEAYRRLTSHLFEVMVKDPIKNVVSNFRKTGLYTEEFVFDLESGLCKSSYSAR